MMGELSLQMPLLVDKIPDTDHWLHEIKWDGYRVMITKDGQTTVISTRNHLDWSYKFPHLIQQLHQLNCQNCILDGELVVYKSDGSTDFQLLQNAIHHKQLNKIHLIVFDILSLEKLDLRPLALTDRKERLFRGLVVRILSRSSIAVLRKSWN